MKAFWLFSESKFSQGERYFGSSSQGCSENLSSKPLQNTCEEVDVFKLQARNSQLYKKRGNLQVFFKDFGCTLFWQLYRQPFLSWKFCKHLSWHQNYLDMDYPPIFRSTPPHQPLIMPYRFMLKFFPCPPPNYSIFWILHIPHL